MADPLAQLVEHNTFNVGVLGSSPKRITETMRGLQSKMAETPVNIVLKQAIFATVFESTRIFSIAINSIAIK